MPPPRLVLPTSPGEMPDSPPDQWQLPAGSKPEVPRLDLKNMVMVEDDPTLRGLCSDPRSSRGAVQTARSSPMSARHPERGRRTASLASRSLTPRGMTSEPNGSAASTPRNSNPRNALEARISSICNQYNALDGPLPKSDWLPSARSGGADSNHTPRTARPSTGRPSTAGLTIDATKEQMWTSELEKIKQLAAWKRPEALKDAILGNRLNSMVGWSSTPKAQGPRSSRRHIISVADIKVEVAEVSVPEGQVDLGIPLEAPRTPLSARISRTSQASRAGSAVVPVPPAEDRHRSTGASRSCRGGREVQPPNPPESPRQRHGKQWHASGPAPHYNGPWTPRKVAEKRKTYKISNNEPEMKEWARLIHSPKPVPTQPYQSAPTRAQVRANVAQLMQEYSDLDGLYDTINHPTGKEPYVDKDDEEPKLWEGENKFSHLSEMHLTVDQLKRLSAERLRHVVKADSQRARKTRRAESPISSSTELPPCDMSAPILAPSCSVSDPKHSATWWHRWRLSCVTLSCVTLSWLRHGETITLRRA
ncbi:hypothetical protein CYMTET_36699 [Cymbomonas tetramitiformis]|uniref:Uncharacterized protein n=1 Tax=Cymbomonas tetramitiformis TaxID=36881 RepID=A0AAE0CGP6_9CHLO|nr:hypothetical protein CYMTET_36699 [Cymbomonas tetramitiformis]